METSLSAREKIFKERINGLEGQVDVLKDQLSKEMRRRQTLIAGSLIVGLQIQLILDVGYFTDDTPYMSRKVPDFVEDS